MADNKRGHEDLGTYARRHPRRMWSGAFLAGTAIGASFMAAKKNHDKKRPAEVHRPDRPLNLIFNRLKTARFAGGFL